VFWLPLFYNIFDNSLLCSTKLRCNVCNYIPPCSSRLNDIHIQQFFCFFVCAFVLFLLLVIVCGGGGGRRLRRYFLKTRFTHGKLTKKKHLTRGVNRFSDRRIWPQKAHGLWIFAVNRADARILKTQWIVDQLWILARIPDCACLDVWRLGSYKSFFSLGRYVNEFIKVIPFSNEAHLNSGVRLLLEFYCMWYSHQACCLRYYLC